MQNENISSDVVFDKSELNTYQERSATFKLIAAQLVYHTARNFLGEIRPLRTCDLLFADFSFQLKNLSGMSDCLGEQLKQLVMSLPSCSTVEEIFGTGRQSLAAASDSALLQEWERVERCHLNKDRKYSHKR